MFGGNQDDFSNLDFTQTVSRPCSRPCSPSKSPIRSVSPCQTRSPSSGAYYSAESSELSQGARRKVPFSDIPVPLTLTQAMAPEKVFLEATWPYSKDWLRNYPEGRELLKDLNPFPISLPHVVVDEFLTPLREGVKPENVEWYIGVARSQIRAYKFGYEMAQKDSSQVLIKELQETKQFLKINQQAIEKAQQSISENNQRFKLQLDDSVKTLSKLTCTVEKNQVAASRPQIQGEASYSGAKREVPPVVTLHAKGAKLILNRGLDGWSGQVNNKGVVPYSDQTWKEVAVVLKGLPDDVLVCLAGDDICPILDSVHKNTRSPQDAVRTHLYSRNLRVDHCS